MKLLFDQNISFRVLKLIENDFPESRHVKDAGLQHSTDRQIWNFAKENDFHIVTLDSDFYDFVTLFGHPPKVIWLRLGNLTSHQMALTISRHKNNIVKFLSSDELKEAGCLEINN